MLYDADLSSQSDNEAQEKAMISAVTYNKIKQLEQKVTKMQAFFVTVIICSCHSQYMVVV
jgi:metal-responsive CopG/Arc/MetJ family transcriptional regulator